MFYINKINLLLGEGETCLFDRPDIIVRKDNTNHSQDLDYDLSKPSSSKEVLREIIRVDDEESIDNSWVDLPKLNNNTNVLNSLKGTLESLQNNYKSQKVHSYSNKRFRSRSLSNDRHQKKYRSTSTSKIAKRLSYYDSLHEKNTPSSITSDEDSSDHGDRFKKTYNGYEHDRSSSPLSSVSVKKSVHKSKREKYNRHSRKRSSRLQCKLKSKNSHDDYLYEEYRRNKMYMNYLKTNIAVQAIQALLEISTNMNGNILQ